MHNHNCGCKHQLEICNHCDVVYCKKCGKEWKFNFYNYTYTFPSQYYGVTSSGSTVTYADTTKATNTCTHH